MEAKILTLIPIFIVTALSIFSPEYMKPLYGSFEGRIIIFIGFLLLLANYFIGRRIVDIRV
jgi:tight adherence protein B